MANIVLSADRTAPFSRVPKTALDDERLSWKAKGILAYLLGKPPGWKVRVADLEKKATDGTHSIRAGLKELRTFGYARLSKITAPGTGLISEWVWEISDCCQFDPDSGFPHLDFPHVENHHHSKKDGSKKQSNKNKTEESKETPPAEGVCFDSKWKPDGRSKEHRLALLKVPKDYPSQIEFEEWEAENTVGTGNYRSDLYGKLCRDKWHEWVETANRWVPIRNWQAYVLALDDKIGDAHSARR